MPNEEPTTDAPQVSKLTSVPLGNLIGAPLLAIIQGQTQAAQATAEFIEQVGFEASPGEGVLGKLRMVTFTYEKSKGKDAEEVQQVKIPLLSLVTIPNIRVKQADLNYSVKVADIQSYESNTSLVSKSKAGSWLGKKRVELSTSVGNLNSTTQGSTQTDSQMNLDIRLKPAPIPGGLSFLYNTMEDALKQSQFIPEFIPLRPLDLVDAQDVIAAYGTLKLTKNYHGFVMEVERNVNYRVIKDIKEPYEAWVHGAAYLRKMYNQTSNNQDVVLQSRVRTYDRENDPEGYKNTNGQFHEAKVRAWEGAHYPNFKRSGIQYDNDQMMMTSEALPLGEEGFDVYTVGSFLLEDQPDFDYLYYVEGLTSISRSSQSPPASYTPLSAYAHYPHTPDDIVGAPLSAGRKVFVQTVRKNELAIYEKTSLDITPRILLKDDNQAHTLPATARIYTGSYIEASGTYVHPLNGTLDVMIITKPLNQTQRNLLAAELYKLYILESSND